MTLMTVKIDRTFFRDLLILLAGVGLYVLSVQLFVVPNRLASNGIAGFSVFANFVFGINPALTFFLVNIPLFLFGWKFLSRRTLLLSIPGTLAMSLWMMIFELLGIQGFQFSQILYAGVFDGILSGIGAGIVVISQGTFGGSILLSRILEEKFKLSIDKVLFGIDILVLGLSLITYLALPNFAVTLLSCYIFSKVVLFVGRAEYREKVIGFFLSNILRKQRN